MRFTLGVSYYLGSMNDTRGRWTLGRWLIVISVGLLVLGAAGAVSAFLFTDAGKNFLSSLSTGADSSQDVTTSEEAIPEPTTYQDLLSTIRAHAIDGDIEAILAASDAYVTEASLSDEDLAGFYIDRAYIFIETSRAAEYRDQAFADVYEADRLAPSASTASAVYDVASFYGNTDAATEYDAIFRQRIEGSLSEQSE